MTLRNKIQETEKNKYHVSNVNNLHISDRISGIKIRIQSIFTSYFPAALLLLACSFLTLHFPAYSLTTFLIYHRLVGTRLLCTFELP